MTEPDWRNAPPVTPLPGDRFVRPLPGSPRVLMAECANRAALEPDRYLCLSDVPEYGLTRYGTVPEVRAAIDELVAATGRLVDHPGSLGLSPLGELVATAIIATNRLAPLPFVEAAETALLQRDDSGLVDLALRRLAERAAVHGNLTAASLGERYGAAGEALFAAWRRAVPRRRGLSWLLRRASLPLTPRRLELPLGRGEALACRQESPALVEQLVDHSSVPRRLALIDAVARLIPDGQFSDAQAVCVQHVLGTQVPVFSTLAAKGLDPAACEIVGVPYSTNFVTELCLRQLGFAVDTPTLGGDGDVDALVEQAIGSALGRACARRAEGVILVLDDGGKATRAIHRDFAGQAHRFRVVEQTTRGIHEVAQLERCAVPIVDVARSAAKRHESPTIGEEVAASVEESLATLSLPPLGECSALVIGYGMIGSGVAKRLQHRGARVTTFDLHPARQAEAERDGFTVAPALAAVLAGQRVVVGCTGRRTLGPEQLARLSTETVLASASSRNVEIDMSVGRQPTTRRQVLAVAGPGDDRYWTWLWQLPDKELVVLHNGFPLNFNGAVETTSLAAIAPTRALMLLGAAQAMRLTAPGLHPLADAAQQALADLLREQVER